MAMKKKEENVSNSSLVQQVRERINARAKKDIVRSVTVDEPLDQISSWVAMPDWFQKATGGLGLPAGHITTILGKNNSGKTSFIMEAMVSAQKVGGLVYLIDSEHKFDLKRFSLMGGIPDEVLFFKGDTLEMAWDAVGEILHDTKILRDEGIQVPVLVCWDSVAASVPGKIADEKESGQAHFAVEAKINNKNIRKFRQGIRETNIAFVNINHFYMSVPQSMYERSELVIKNGEEWGWMSTLILLFKKGAKISRTYLGDKQRIGVVSKITIEKGHFHGRTMDMVVNIVDKGILATKEELEEYMKSLRGNI